MMTVNVLIVLSFALALYFPVAYSFSRWNDYTPGRAVMFFSVIVAVSLGLSVYRVLFGPAPEWVRAPVFLLIIAGLAVMDFALTREQTKERRARKIRQEKESVH